MDDFITKVTDGERQRDLQPSAFLSLERPSLDSMVFHSDVHSLWRRKAEGDHS